MYVNTGRRTIKWSRITLRLIWLWIFSSFAILFWKLELRDIFDDAGEGKKTTIQYCTTYHSANILCNTVPIYHSTNIPCTRVPIYIRTMYPHTIATIILNKNFCMNCFLLALTSCWAQAEGGSPPGESYGVEPGGTGHWAVGWHGVPE